MQPLDYAPSDIYRHGSCSRCHGTEGLVDIDVMIDYEGNVALCRGCIADAALAAGLVVGDDGVRRLGEAEARADAAEAKALEAERILSALQASLNRARTKR